ncbi:unnamed protein product, partial [marine sediment metagenome]
MEEAVLKRILRTIELALVLEEMAPFNVIYLPLSETATAGSTTTIDHFPDADRAWYVSKVYITTTANTTAKLKIK